MSTCRPLYKRYPRENRCQPAELFIGKDGTSHLRWNPEIGNAVTFDVFHGIHQCFGVDPTLDGKAMVLLLEEVKPLAEELMVSGSEVIWDGRNHVRRFNDRGVELLCKIEQICDSAIPLSEQCWRDDCEFCSDEDR